MKTQSRRPFASESTGSGARMAGAARRPGCTTNAAPNSWEAKSSDMERDASMQAGTGWEPPKQKLRKILTPTDMDRDIDGSDTFLGHVLKVAPQEGTKGEGEDEDEPGLLRLRHVGEEQHVASVGARGCKAEVATEAAEAAEAAEATEAKAEAAEERRRRSLTVQSPVRLGACQFRGSSGKPPTAARKSPSEPPRTSPPSRIGKPSFPFVAPLCPGSFGLR